VPRRASLRSSVSCAPGSSAPDPRSRPTGTLAGSPSAQGQERRHRQGGAQEPVEGGEADGQTDRRPGVPGCRDVGGEVERAARRERRADQPRHDERACARPVLAPGDQRGTDERGGEEQRRSQTGATEREIAYGIAPRLGTDPVPQGQPGAAGGERDVGERETEQAPLVRERCVRRHRHLRTSPRRAPRADSDDEHPRALDEVKSRPLADVEDACRGVGHRTGRRPAGGPAGRRRAASAWVSR
jgi:hypothetical protein